MLRSMILSSFFLKISYPNYSYPLAISLSEASSTSLAASSSQAQIGGDDRNSAGGVRDPQSRRLNRAFRGAASSDAVWEKKLPPNYEDLLKLMPDERYENMSDKDIFRLLSYLVPFDDGYKLVWVDKVTSKVCMSISAKAMAITEIEDRRYLELG